MPITLSLWSARQGEIRRFLQSFYQKDHPNEELTNRWMGDFCNPLDSIDMISALMDNIENYELTMYLHMENGYLHKITARNYDDVIKGLIGIFYMPIRESEVEV